MSDEGRTILVIGGTGQQGGATARHLLDRGWAVRVLVRDPDKPAAQALASKGAALVRGDLDDPASFAAAFAGVYGVFSVQTADHVGVEGETRQGKAVADAAREANVAHLVYSSVGGAERDSGIPHFDSKWQVEQHIRKLGLPATILRPVFFMDNFRSFLGPRLIDGSLISRLPIHPDTRLQLIAVDDIGRFAADAFAQPETYLGAELEIAGDELTGPQIAAVFQSAAGVPAQFIEQPIEEIRSFSSDAATMFEWFNTGGYAADIAALRVRQPELLTLAAWLRKTNWSPVTQ